MNKKIKSYQELVAAADEDWQGPTDGNLEFSKVLSALKEFVGKQLSSYDNKIEIGWDPYDRTFDADITFSFSGFNFLRAKDDFGLPCRVEGSAHVSDSDPVELIDKIKAKLDDVEAWEKTVGLLYAAQLEKT